MLKKEAAKLAKLEGMTSFLTWFLGQHATELKRLSHNHRQQIRNLKVNQEAKLQQMRSSTKADNDKLEKEMSLNPKGKRKIDD